MENNLLTPEQEAELKELDTKLAAEHGGLPEEADNTETPDDKPDEKPEGADNTDNEPDEEPDEAPEEEIEVDEDDSTYRQPHVPYKKLKAEREKRKELESQLDTMKSEIESLKSNKNLSEKDKELEIDKLAEEYGVDAEFTKKLASSILSKVKSPISEDELAEWREERARKIQAEKYNSEFDDLLEVEPNAKEYKEKLKRLAFSSKYAGTNFKPLIYIYAKEIKPSLDKKKTVESGTTKKTDDSAVLDYANMSEEDALKLPAEKFLEWADYKAQNH